MVDRALGCIFGALVGDSVGSYLEFSSDVTAAKVSAALEMPGGGHWGVSPGQITDDGEMTLAQLRALSSTAPEFDDTVVARAYLKWAQSQPFDMGRATHAALGWTKTLKHTASELRERAAKNDRSQSNGALMRTAPLGVFAHKLAPTDVAKLSKRDCTLTHPNPNVVLACSAYCVAIAHLVASNGDVDESIVVTRTWMGQKKPGEVHLWFESAVAPGALPEPFGPAIGFIKIPFHHAFRLLVARTSYVDAIKEMLCGGGDTDTNCCIVGAMLGAAQGVDAVPRQWREKIVACDTTGKITRTRPEFCRPGSTIEQEIRNLYELAPDPKP